MMKSNSCFTIIMVICLICSISRWKSICFELWPNFGILLIAASHWESRLGAYRKGVYSFATLPEDSSR
ncbi:hypothetical protein Gotri_024117 [Gossypium trilobum]|uniref:Secreted protein n=2 Tax=Gossypium TaxID=3633 RepID=A0A7J9DL82_9ROSI|nr:hypothetical protein [Gossypium trilobum]